MRRILISFMLIVIILLGLPQEVHAVVDPLAVPNNHFGIHIHDENDLVDAANLVNSGGGDWGYVTLVIREDERDTLRWQRAFDSMRKLHLIPIIRVATSIEGDNWKKPNKSGIDSWVNFFDSLNWVTQNRYIIVGNEPNHAKEWGGVISASEYADYLINFSDALKNSNRDYFVLPAALDTSAPDSNSTLSPEKFIKNMLEKSPDVYEHIDGWNSHSYPNPGFVGLPTDTGRSSIKNYEWEDQLLKSLGLDLDLPVFITETGWVHEEGKVLGTNNLTDYYLAAFTVWNDPKLVAVTPFTLNYTSDPFYDFSWKKADGTFFDFYNDLKLMRKTPGTPQRENYLSVQSISYSPALESQYLILNIYIKNTGQYIWESNKITLSMLNQDLKLETLSSPALYPNEEGVVIAKIKVTQADSDKLLLSYDGNTIGSTYWQVPTQPLNKFSLNLKNFNKLYENKLLKLTQVGI